eukprot:PhM_4_TR18787/c0_g1_i3/m.21490
MYSNSTEDDHGSVGSGGGHDFADDGTFDGMFTQWRSKPLRSKRRRHRRSPNNNNHNSTNNNNSKTRSRVISKGYILPAKHHHSDGNNNDDNEDDPDDNSGIDLSFFFVSNDDSELYKLRKWSLRFCDTNVEDRYITYLYQTSGFLGGKLFVALIIIMTISVYLIFPDEKTADLYLEPTFIMEHINMTCFAMFALICAFRRNHFMANIEVYIFLYYVISTTAYLLMKREALERKKRLTCRSVRSGRRNDASNESAFL